MSSIDQSFALLQKQVQLILTESHPRKKYHRREWATKKSIIHWGQRKLLLSEIMFLTRYGHLSDTVLYVGAAPGTHIPFLSDLFPDHKFILVDPNAFQAKNSKKITIINDYFTDEMAEEYSEKKVLFVCDMRTADHRQMTPLENEEFVIKDNLTQAGWVMKMKPAKSMLKFRCAYPDVYSEKTKMLKGDIYIQVWPGASSTETRLVVDDELEMIEYDNVVFEEQLFHHNIVTRYSKFDQPVKGEGLNQTFDASAEVVILGEFLQKFPEYKTGNLFKSIAEMSKAISKAITTTGRTLASEMKDPEKKRNFPKVNHRQFYEKPTNANKAKKDDHKQQHGLKETSQKHDQVVSPSASASSFSSLVKAKEPKS